MLSKITPALALFSIGLLAVIYLSSRAFTEFRSSNSSTTESTTQKPPQDEITPISLNQAYTQNIPAECHILIEEDQVSQLEDEDFPYGINTTVYISGNRLKLIMPVTEDEQPRNANVLYKDNRWWIWHEGQSEGQTYLEESGNGVENFITRSQVYSDSITCKSTQMPIETFTVPEQVTFVDLQDKVNQVIQRGIRESIDNDTWLNR